MFYMKMSCRERDGGRPRDEFWCTRDSPSKTRSKRTSNERASQKQRKRSKSSSSSDSEVSLPPEEIQKIKEMVRQKKVSCCTFKIFLNCFVGENVLSLMLIHTILRTDC